MNSCRISCPDCNSGMTLCGRRFVCERFPWCRGSHAADARGEPLGTPADHATRRARWLAHRALDQAIIVSGQSEDNLRNQVRQALRLSCSGLHIADCDRLICLRLIRYLSSTFGIRVRELTCEEQREIASLEDNRPADLIPATCPEDVLRFISAGKAKS